MRLLWLLMMVVEVVEGDGHQSGVSRCPPRDHVTRSLPDSGRLSPPDSGGQSPAGVRQTPQTLSDSSGLFQTPAGLELLSWQVSHWISPDLESGRLRRSLPDYVGQCTVLIHLHVDVWEMVVNNAFHVVKKLSLVNHVIS